MRVCVDGVRSSASNARAVDGEAVTCLVVLGDDCDASVRRSSEHSMNGAGIVEVAPR